MKLAILLAQIVFGISVILVVAAFAPWIAAVPIVWAFFKGLEGAKPKRFAGDEPGGDF